MSLVTREKMISPAEYESAIVAVQFVCGVANNGRQYTFAELCVSERTDREIEFSFYVPNDSEPRDELELVKVLGGTPVNEAMGAWQLSSTDVFRAHNRTLPVTVKTVDNETSVKVSGCNQRMSVNVPPGPCFVNCCWSHNIVANKIFIPTMNESMSSWRMSAVVMQGEVKAHGQKPTLPLSRFFRFDLAFSEAQVSFRPSNDAVLIRRIGQSLPYVNLWIPLQLQDVCCREYHSMCGAVLVDNTRCRMMTFYDVLFVAMPVICGAFIRDAVNFPHSYVPLSITERVTRGSPMTFENAPFDCNTVNVFMNGSKRYSINLERKQMYSGVYWVDLCQTQ